ncbi:MAG: decarboxylase [Halochromatium sp.]|nr:decarboxylase [Halochromatium sp.]
MAREMYPSYEQLRRLSQRFGNSFYIAYPDRYASNISNFLLPLRAIYPNTNLGYSLKTNYLPAFFKKALSRGLYAEVVSRMEYDLALMIGATPNRIIFNGPVKTLEDMRISLLGGARVNLECHTEVDMLESISRIHPDYDFEVGLRCNFDLGESGRSRFGFDADNGDLQLAFRRINDLPRCRVSGLHFHYSRDRTAASYRTRSEKIVRISNELFMAEPPDFLDLGGGFAGPMSDELRKQLPFTAPSFDEYAEAIAAPIARTFGISNGPELILEPGVAMVGDTMDFISYVFSIKNIAGQRYAVTTGSYQNIKPSVNDINPPLSVISAAGASNSNVAIPTDVVGYTCMEQDMLFRGLTVPIDAGDYVLISNAGAYSFVFKPPFISPAPAILSYDQPSGDWIALRLPETVQDLMAGYVI